MECYNLDFLNLEEIHHQIKIIITLRVTFHDVQQYCIGQNIKIQLLIMHMVDEILLYQNLFVQMIQDKLSKLLHNRISVERQSKNLQCKVVKQCQQSSCWMITKLTRSKGIKSTNSSNKTISFSHFFVYKTNCWLQDEQPSFLNVIHVENDILINIIIYSIYQNMLPPIKPYKLHPKLVQIQQQKRKRQQILLQARIKQQEELGKLKQEKKEYQLQNKHQIQSKKEHIYKKKKNQRDRIHEEDQKRSAIIAERKAQRLMKILPERKQLIQMLKAEYLESIQEHNKNKQQYISKIIEQRIIQQKIEEIPLNQKIKQNGLIDCNDGLCVICLVTECCIYMNECKHLVSCKDCQFVIRLQKKCPLCRKNSKYTNIKQQKRSKSKNRMKKKQNVT